MCFFIITTIYREKIDIFNPNELYLRRRRKMKFLLIYILCYTIIKDSHFVPTWTRIEPSYVCSHEMQINEIKIHIQSSNFISIVISY